MKKSIIFKTLVILGSLIVTIFIVSNFLTNQSDKALIEQIRDYNLATVMRALDSREENSLALNKQMMIDTSKMIAKNSSAFLLNYDEESLNKSLLFDIKKEGLKAIIVVDSVINENFSVAYKENEKVLFKKTLPKSYTKYTNIVENIYHIEGENKNNIGSITLYYDESLIKNKISKLRNNTKEVIQKFNSTIDSELKKAHTIKLYIAIGSLILILIVSSILLIRFVNTPLRKLQIGLDNFFLFLQNKTQSTQKINLDSVDEFGQMASSLNENIAVSAKLHAEIRELNTNLEKKITEKTKKITMILNNAGQGFLTFDENFLIDDEYSKECEKLLGVEIVSQDITSLLFKDKSKIELFKTTLLMAVKESVKIKRNSYISLLPSIVLLNKKAVKLEYRILEDSKFMLILTNITSEKKLEKKIKKKQEILKMIVAVVSESDIFYGTKTEYNNFINNFMNMIDKTKTPLYNISKMYRIIHTFKGTFSQLYMQDLVLFLHAIENKLSSMLKGSTHSNEDLAELLESCDFNDSLDCSLSIIKEILGDDFLKSDNYLKVDLIDLSHLQEKIKAILDNYTDTTPECQDILCHVQRLSSTKLISILHPFVSLSTQLATRLEKEIYDFEIIGDNKYTITENIKPFIKSLIHVFRNSIDHGIESPEQRVDINKDEKGTLLCNFETRDENLYINISDDGAGIDIEKLAKKLESKGVDCSNKSEKEILLHIFDDNLSTKDSVSNLSGRGVGMSAVKYELDKLKGEVFIKSKKNIGTSFEFVIPV